MKKILFFLLLLIPFIAKAEVRITDAILVDSTEEIEAEKKPAFHNLDIKFNLKFQELQNFAKYKITIKNDTKKDYEINDGEQFSKGEYIKYEFELVENEDNIIKPNQEKIIYITASYNKEVPAELFKAGKYVEDNAMDINMTPTEVNPKTKVGYIVLIAAILMIASLAIVLINKYKINKFALVFLGILAIPLTISAIEKIVIKIQTNIEILAPEKMFSFNPSGCNSNLNYGLIRNIKYRVGMTFEDFINSEYFTNLQGDVLPSMENELEPASRITIEGLKIELQDLEGVTLLTYSAEFQRCTAKVPYAYYVYEPNATQEEREAKAIYLANYEACLNEFGVDQYGNSGNSNSNHLIEIELPHKSQLIRPQTEVIYKTKTVC
jgi:hypothetical protein